jgi:acyl carrier protein
LEGKFDVTIDGEQVLPENFSSVESIETLVNNSEKNA